MWDKIPQNTLRVFSVLTECGEGLTRFSHTRLYLYVQQIEVVNMYRPRFSIIKISLFLVIVIIIIIIIIAINISLYRPVH